MAFDSAPIAASGPSLVYFDRCELDLLLSLYGRMVGAGLWRDYAIDTLRDAAVFSVFRRACETPIYRIEKRALHGQRQGAWSVFAHGGLVMRRGSDLAEVLKVFDRARFAVIK
ncbi:MAG TPA: DUF2794 domain-containing protein [Caulobacteraceae bacterium]|nr:DUF2794 domain-containing protein [Caulobacteraceae bacterium]